MNFFKGDEIFAETLHGREAINVARRELLDCVTISRQDTQAEERCG